MVNQGNWRFEIDRTSVIDRMRGVQGPQDTFEIPTASELAYFLVQKAGDDISRIQRLIDDRIHSDPCAAHWRKRRTLLKDLRHFPRYRKGQYDVYHKAARAVSAGNATKKQNALVSGLESEIEASQIIVPAGQVLFHRRANDQITGVEVYPTFISTSLNAVVALNSALRRAGMVSGTVHPLYMFSDLCCFLPALWGQAGNSCEYEILLPRGLSCRQTASGKADNFCIIEADIVGRSPDA